MTRDEHRARALALLDDVAKTTVGSPARLSWLAEAQVHATLALSAPAEQPTAPRPTPAKTRRPRTPKETPSE